MIKSIMTTTTTTIIIIILIINKKIPIYDYIPDLLDGNPIYTEDQMKERTFEANIQAEAVGQQLDFFTKQLKRLREERRISAMVMLAERTRRMREAEESGQ